MRSDVWEKEMHARFLQHKGLSRQQPKGPSGQKSNLKNFHFRQEEPRPHVKKGSAEVKGPRGGRRRGKQKKKEKDLPCSARRKARALGRVKGIFRDQDNERRLVPTPKSRGSLKRYRQAGHLIWEKYRGVGGPPFTSKVEEKGKA